MVADASQVARDARGSGGSLGSSSRGGIATRRNNVANVAQGHAHAVFGPAAAPKARAALRAAPRSNDEDMGEAGRLLELSPQATLESSRSGRDAFSPIRNSLGNDATPPWAQRFRCDMQLSRTDLSSEFTACASKFTTEMQAELNLRDERIATRCTTIED